MPRGARAAKAEITADSRKLDPALRVAKKKWERFAGDVKKTLSSAWAEIGKGFFRQAGAMGMDVITRSIGDAARAAMEFESKISRMQAALGLSGTAVLQLRKTMDEVSSATGIARNDLLAAGDALAQNGSAADITAARMRVLADAHLATGASMETVAATLGMLKRQFGLIDPAQQERALSALAVTAESGLEKQAELVTGLANDWKKLGGGAGDAVQMTAQLGAALQMLTRETGSADAAAGSLGSVIQILQQRAGDLADHGIKVFTRDAATGAKQLRPLEQILADIGGSKLMKDPTLRMKIFKGASLEAVETLTGDLDAYKKAATDAAKADVLRTRASRIQQSPAFQMQKAMNDLNQAITRAFTPARIQAFTRGMADLVQLAAKLAEHVKVVALLVGAGKAVQIGRAGHTLGRGLAASGGALAKLGGKALSLASGFAAAATAGYAVGTAFDELTGASSGLADWMFRTFGTAQTVAEHRGEFQATYRNFRDREQRQLEGNLARVGSAEPLASRQAAARTVVRIAKERGYIGAGGAVQPGTPAAMGAGLRAAQQVLVEVELSEPLVERKRRIRGRRAAR